MTDPNIEDYLLHAMTEGKVDLTFGDKGEMRASITPKGEAVALEQIGGKDIADVASALTMILIKHGDAFGTLMPKDRYFKTWLEMVQIARLIRGIIGWDWQDVVNRLNSEFGTMHGDSPFKGG